MLSIIFFGALVAVLVWVTVSGKDAWPFSHYPMFADPANLASLLVVRLALETREGDVIWWHSRFYRYPEYVGRQLKRTYRLEETQSRFSVLAPLERRKYLVEVMRLMRLEEGSFDRYRAIHLIQRTASADPARGLVIREQSLARIPLAELRDLRS
ncbi:MAG TPA: hypothetical protein VJ302_10215 [Blastocatellia bacterium]|nr:hypothetical protein [Blastocatellia bacterium]